MVLNVGRTSAYTIIDIISSALHLSIYTAFIWAEFENNYVIRCSVRSCFKNKVLKRAPAARHTFACAFWKAAKRNLQLPCSTLLYGGDYDCVRDHGKILFRGRLYCLYSLYMQSLWKGNNRSVFTNVIRGRWYASPPKGVVFWMQPRRGVAWRSVACIYTGVHRKFNAAPYFE